MLKHPFMPIYDKNSKILILGSFPSVKSRENNFYYLHPQNRFWKILAKIFNEENISTVEEKTNMLLNNNIALFDVIKECNIQGSLDANIKDVKVNDINVILNNSKVKKIFFNGKKSYELFFKYNKSEINFDVLPSTSSANASFSFDRLYECWKNKLLDALNE